MRGVRRRVGGAILLFGAASSTVLGLRVPDPPGAEAASPVPQVPVWSARRLPLDLAETTAAMRLPQDVEAAVAGSDACFVLAEAGEPVLERRATDPFIPASTQKLLVGAAALGALGADHRFRTELVAASPPAGGSVDRLWLVGGGDPLLAVREYAEHLRTVPLAAEHPVTPQEDLADAVAAAGITQVGGVVGDASRHEGDPTVPTWKPAYIADRDVSYLSALTVNGGWSAWSPATVTAPDPAVEAAAQLTRLLRARGVAVAGDPSRGEAPAGAARVAAVSSPPLSEIVTTLLRESDNLVAELLTREIGLVRRGVGDTPDGTAAVVEVLDELGVETSGVTLVDGSGLDRANRATCAAVMGALSLRERPGFEALDRGLAVAGRSGTLVKRMIGTELEGRLRAKTGSLNGVTGLVGVFDRTPELSFSLLANDSFPWYQGTQIQEAVAAILLRYPYDFPEPELLGPPPARTRAAATPAAASG